MKRRFCHLSQTEIRDIITSHQSGEPKLSIARRLAIDNSTVHYHIRKFEQSYPEQGGVYALIRSNLRMECQHPSYKCLVCGKAQDAIQGEERRLIRELTARLAVANERLKRAGYVVE